eukprot:SAG31_NODE_4865_length_2899_cov_8.739286_1_plen_99_part_00
MGQALPHALALPTLNSQLSVVIGVTLHLCKLQIGIDQDSGVIRHHCVPFWGHLSIVTVRSVTLQIRSTQQSHTFNVDSAERVLSTVLSTQRLTQTVQC